jgi:transposase-like protein
MQVHNMPGMNKLPNAKRTQILAMLCEGSSMHSIARVVDVSFNSVAKLLKDAGATCEAFHDDDAPPSDRMIHAL